MTTERASGRDRILAAAAELFSERGYARTSTARLAAAADVPQGLIFYHFGTKEGLLLTLIREQSTQRLADLVPADPPADPRVALAQLWTTLGRVLGEPTPLHRIVFRESEHHPELRDRAEEIREGIAEVIAGYLAKVTGARSPSARHRAAAILLVAAASANAFAEGRTPPAPAVVADLLLDGIG